MLTCIDVALLLKDVLDRLELAAFPKVSGSKGLQVHVPLNGSDTYRVVQPFAKAVAELLAKEHPRLIVADMSKALRKNKVFIDWSQNADHKTTVAVYSLRAKRHRPYVSMPMTWEELRAARKDRDAKRLDIVAPDAILRMRERGDLFAPVLTLAQRLPDAFVPSASIRSGDGYTLPWSKLAEIRLKPMIICAGCTFSTASLIASAAACFILSTTNGCRPLTPTVGPQMPAVSGASCAWVAPTMM